MNLDAASRELRNNFDVLRLVAAAMVLVSHSFVVVGAHEPHVGHFPLGTLGVEIFFAISGFLVAKSWFAQPRLRAFAVKRGLRILPALTVTVVLSAFVLGPVVSEVSGHGYFASSSTYTYSVDDVAATATGGVVRDVSHSLPGVFTDNPDTSVNRSLWTLPIEVQAYMALALLGLAGLLTFGLPAVAAGLFALSVAPHGIADLPVIGWPLDWIRGADGENAHLLALFAFSALLYRYRTRVSLRADLAAVAAIVALAAIAIATPLERAALVVCIPYLALFAAYRSWNGLRALTAHADVSYGLYLLAFPVQQTIVHLWGGSLPSPGVVVALALPITYLLALASWHLVEKRALRLKGVLAGRRPRTAPARATPEREPAAVQV
jgi:peptidoglycan/LPS O-acetylase OafA/YrhL